MTEASKVRWWQKVIPTDGCWHWTGYLSDQGYGRLWDGKAVQYAHRLSFEMFRGQIPDGLDLDHLCRNRGCVNPAHLEPVTRRENVSRGKALITHCPHGHEYTPQNTIYRKAGGRVCRTCQQAHRRACYLRHKANIVAALATALTMRSMARAA